MSTTRAAGAVDAGDGGARRFHCDVADAASAEAAVGKATGGAWRGAHPGQLRRYRFPPRLSGEPDPRPMAIDSWAGSFLLCRAARYDCVPLRRMVRLRDGSVTDSSMALMSNW